ncbi:unnamed protein product [Rhizoctonia solani]|uniref:Deacetylase sirtuin-type domain-containing protein n=1 Tax=Rhizoctonia solani TaxID=456999 RepID=A0A8H3ANC9_9AGAM|nr:unnamed protein product [Rhizoctonia solani]
MATTLEVTSTRVLDFTEKHSERLAVIIDTIAATEKIILMCGPGVSVACGMPYFNMDESVHLKHGSFDYQTTLKTVFDECSVVNERAKSLREDKLAAFNKYMAGLRIQARNAPTSSFHRLLQRALRERRVVRCLTTNFDGLDEQPDAADDAQIIRMYGDNRFLRCLMRSCPGVYSADITHMDDELKDGKTVLCPPCTKKAQELRSQRVASRSTLRFLRPSVDAHIPIDLHPNGDSRNDIIKIAKRCQLLLVVGLPLNSGEVYDLVRDIGSEVHQQYGAVVYVDNQPIRGRDTSQSIDFHLQVDIEEFSSRVLAAMDKSSKSQTATKDVNVDPTIELDQSEIWYEVVNNVIEPESTSEEPDFTGPVCCMCGVSDLNCLIKCIECGDHLCIPSNYGPYGRHKTCLVFRGYTGGMIGPPPTKESESETFICPWCWKHSERGLYPHFIRPAPQVNVHLRGMVAPRMAMVVYYLDQFWPQTKHLCSLVKHRWQVYGWSSHVEPVKLEELSKKQSLLENCEWESGTFDFFVVYLTHGLQGELGYQISHDQALDPVQFLQKTLSPLHGVIQRSQHTRAVMMCCGHPLYSARYVRETQEWINRDGVLDSLLSFFNIKLAPAFVAGMIARMTTGLARRGVTWARSTHINTWLTDSVACGHSDILYMDRFNPPHMWLFSPFDSRPLGKELPHLMEMCKCTQQKEPSEDERRRRTRKVWMVSHNGKTGTALREIELDHRSLLGAPSVKPRALQPSKPNAGLQKVPIRFVFKTARRIELTLKSSEPGPSQVCPDTSATFMLTPDFAFLTQGSPPVQKPARRVLSTRRDDRIVKTVPQHVFLGVLIDQELRWTAQSHRALAGGMAWASHLDRIARKLYGSIATPRFIYAADAWYRPVILREAEKGTGSIGFARRLARVQCVAALSILGGLRSIPRPP